MNSSLKQLLEETVPTAPPTLGRHGDGLYMIAITTLLTRVIAHQVSQVVIVMHLFSIAYDSINQCSNFKSDLTEFMVCSLKSFTYFVAFVRTRLQSKGTIDKNWLEVWA